MLGNLLELAGGLISSSQTKQAHQKQLAMAQSQFRQQMDHSIRRRVEDAKRAGVHPLFALGASVSASPTLSAQQPTGSALGDALRGIGGRIASAQLDSTKSETERNEAEAAYFRALAAKTSQDFTSRGRDGASVVMPPGASTDPAAAVRSPEVVYGPAEFFSPQVPVSKKPGVQAGTTPAHQDYKVPGLGNIRILSQGLQADEIRQIDYVLKTLGRAFTTGSMKMYEFAKKRLQDMLGRRLQYKGKDRTYGVTSKRGGPG
jgi:hypothetical protein